MQHRSTKRHEIIRMSDEGHEWTWRAPPKDFKADFYTICKNWRKTQSCTYGWQCVEAHGEAELAEWNERYQYRRINMNIAIKNVLFGK